jgi:hypothetical protein
MGAAATEGRSAGDSWNDIVMEENAEDTASQKRRKGTIGGLAMIVFGLISAIWVYVGDSSSLDFFRMMNATYFAIVHVVLWTIAGLIIILWYNRPPPDFPSHFDTRDRGDRNLP